MSTHTTSKPINYKEVYFNHPSLKKITGNPNCADLQSMYKHIKSNSASVPITLGGGCHGHLGLITVTGTYNHITPNNTHLCPTHPSLLGVNNRTAAQLAEGIRQNNIAITTFHESNNIKHTIVNQVQAALYESILMIKPTKTPESSIVTSLTLRINLLIHMETSTTKNYMTNASKQLSINMSTTIPLQTPSIPYTHIPLWTNTT